MNWKGRDANKIITNTGNHPDVDKVLRTLKKYVCGIFKPDPPKREKKKVKKDVRGYIQSDEIVMCTWKD